MISDLYKLVRLSFSRRGADFGEVVLQGNDFTANSVDAILAEGNVLGAEGRSQKGRERRMMRNRVDGNDFRA